MNSAMFIAGIYEADNEVLPLINKIQCAQTEICGAERDMEIGVGMIEVIKDADAYKTILTADIKVLDDCCERISKSIDSIKKAYEKLIEIGIFEEKNR